MSAKKNTGLPKERNAQIVDPGRLGSLIVDVRNLLRFHQNVGIKSYPQKKRLQFLFQPHGSAAPKAGGRTAGKNDPGSNRATAPAMAEVRRAVMGCAQCMDKKDFRIRVLGRGPDHCRLMVVGDWLHRQDDTPSADILFGEAEDDMLARMMAAIGLSMEEVYVCNAVKCVPTAGHPDAKSCHTCFSHLQREIMALQPAFIMAMGEIAAGLLTGSSNPLVRLRGRFYPYAGSQKNAIRVMPTFHPHFLLKHSELKKMVWQDLKMLQRQLAR